MPFQTTLGSLRDGMAQEKKTARFYRTGRGWSLIALLIIAAVLTGARLRAVDTLSGYVAHVDEGALVGGAVDMINTGNLNPRTFRYPSLPIYLTAGSMLLANTVMSDGFQSGKSALQRPGNRGHPHSHREIFWLHRIFFGLMGAAVFIFVGLIAWHLTPSGGFAWVAPLLLGCSVTFQISTATYHNVDTVAVFFALATLVTILACWRNDTWWGKCILPGARAGATTACKYNSGLILIPCALAILFGVRSRRNSKLGLLIASAAAIFFLVVPFALLDFERFYADIMFEIRHYREGHRGNEGPTGIPQLLYYWTRLSTDFGLPAAILAVLGIAYGTSVRPKQTLAIASFPILMLAHMSTNRVHFVRTVLPVFALLPVFTSVGISAVLALAHRAFKALPNRLQVPPLFVSGTVSAALGLLLLLTVPHATFLDRNIRGDTRDRMVQWLKKQQLEETAILLAEDAWFAEPDKRMLQAEAIEPELANLHELLDNHAGERVIVVFPQYKEPSLRNKLRKSQEERDAFLAQVRPRVDAANQLIMSLSQRAGALKVYELKGGRVAIAALANDRAHPISNPSLTAFSVSLKGL